ncbi:hypothetical protein HPG69_007418 [Diceros bicornis minor]|uniref:EF-hand domain-containing protein n=1 Tax=Diceros bicornis minor TaxID=77932 RepID=A0A7J7F8H6_DICBM|nr:hypothetical protein HPG69_007418 [Diceros bicornis minor]
MLTDLENAMDSLIDEKDALTWFKELDVNRDGAINFEEFLILVIKVGLEAHKKSHQV